MRHRERQRLRHETESGRRDKWIKKYYYNYAIVPSQIRDEWIKKYYFLLQLCYSTITYNCATIVMVL